MNGSVTVILILGIDGIGVQRINNHIQWLKGETIHAFIEKFINYSVQLPKSTAAGHAILIAINKYVS